MAEITLQGFDELQKRLDLSGAIRIGLMEAAIYAQDWMAKYPPGSEANQPGRYSLTNHRPMGYYVRGQGAYYPLVKDGAAVAYRRTKRKSEKLGHKWATAKIHINAAGDAVQIGNNASYGPYVQGDKQASFHKAHGWRTVQDLQRGESKKVLEFLKIRIQKKLSGG